MKLSLLTPLALAVLFTAACGSDEPSISTLANNLCTCEEQLGEEPWTAEDRTACRNQMTSQLAVQPNSCLECLDSQIGDGTEPAACAAVDTCTTCG